MRIVIRITGPREDAFEVRVLNPEKVRILAVNGVDDHRSDIVIETD